MKTTDANGLPLILQPFRPTRGGWAEWPTDELVAQWHGMKPYVIERYYSRGEEAQVLTAIEMVHEDGTIVAPLRPEYHLSVSGLKWMATQPYRVSESRARWLLRQFGAEGFTEDNHAPHGIARNYWRPVADQFAGQICECVKSESAIKEMKGDYVWRA